jgi:hypothetical protein
MQQVRHTGNYLAEAPETPARFVWVMATITATLTPPRGDGAVFLIDMTTIEFILAILVVLWWGILSWHQFVCHRRRLAQVAAPLTPQETRDYAPFTVDRRRMGLGVTGFFPRASVCVMMSPFVVFFLPYCLYYWLVTDPWDKAR